jgi:hypothetical protein
MNMPVVLVDFFLAYLAKREFLMTLKIMGIVLVG